MTAPLSDGLHPVPAGKLATVTTTLEMRAPPADLAVGTAEGCTLRPMAGPDLSGYRALFRAVGAPWLWVSRLALDDAGLAAILADPAVLVLAAERDRRAIGLLELDFRTAGACEIAFFGLVQAATGQGLGPWLMRHAQHEAWSRPIERLWVHTCDLDHPAALGFYRRHGFVPVRRAVEVLDDPRRLGLLPADAAPTVPML